MHADRSTTVYIPWREFVAVKRARVDPAAPKLDPSSVRQLGLVLSRFEFNGLANPNYWAGKFSLKVHYCVQTLHPCCRNPTKIDGCRLDASKVCADNAVPTAAWHCRHRLQVLHSEILWTFVVQPGPLLMWTRPWMSFRGSYSNLQIALAAG